MSLRCRLCLCEIYPDDERYGFKTIYDSAESGLSVMSLVHILIPELYLGVSKDPVICSKCHKELGIAYQFRLTCLRSENLIGQYLRATKNASQAIDLEDVVDYWMRNKKGSELSENQDDDKTQDESNDVPSVETHEEPKSKSDEKSSSSDPQTSLLQSSEGSSETEIANNLNTTGQLDLNIPTRTYIKKPKTPDEINKGPTVKMLPKKITINLIPYDPDDKDLTNLIDELKKNNNLAKLGLSKETNDNQTYIIKKIIDKSVNSVSFALIPMTHSKKADSVTSSDDERGDPFDWFKESVCQESSGKPANSAADRNDLEGINAESLDETNNEESQFLSEIFNQSIGDKQNDTVTSENVPASSSCSDTPVQMNRSPGFIRIAPKPIVPILPDKPLNQNDNSTISDMPRPIIRVRSVSSLQKVRTLNHELWPLLTGCNGEPSFDRPKSYPATPQKPEKEFSNQQCVSLNSKSVSPDSKIPQKNIRIVTLNSKYRTTTQPNPTPPKISRIRKCYPKSIKNSTAESPSVRPQSVTANIVAIRSDDGAPNDGLSECPAKDLADSSIDNSGFVVIKEEPIDFDSSDAFIDRDNALELEDERLHCDFDVFMSNTSADDAIDIKDEPMDHSDSEAVTDAPDLCDNISQVSSSGTTDSTKSASETAAMQILDDECVKSIVDNIPEVGFKRMAKSEDKDVTLGSGFSSRKVVGKRNRKKRRNCSEESNKQVTINNTELQDNISPVSAINISTPSDYFVLELCNPSHNNTVSSEEKVYKLENNYDDNKVHLNNTEFRVDISLKSGENKSSAESREMSELNKHVSLNNEELQENMSPLSASNRSTNSCYNTDSAKEEVCEIENEMELKNNECQDDNSSRETSSDIEELLGNMSAVKTCNTLANPDYFVIELNNLSHNETANAEETMIKLENNYNENGVDLHKTESQDHNLPKSSQKETTNTEMPGKNHLMITSTDDSFNNKHDPYSEIVISAAGKIRGKRMRNKGHVCYFCQRYVIKMARHFESLHSKETEVVKFLVHPKFSEKRRKGIAEIIRVGDFYHNCNVLASKKGELILIRRPSASEAKFAKASDYGPCPNCLGFLLKKHLWHHLAHCREKVEGMKPRQVIAESNALISNIFVLGFSKEYIENITSKLHSDDIGDICRNDDLILKLGAMQFEKYGVSKIHTYEPIRQSMRQLARLLIELNKLDNSSKSLADFLIPSKFDMIVQATKAVVESMRNSTNPLGPAARVPSLALKIGYSLRKCLNILRGAAIRARNIDRNESAISFHNLLDAEWGARISSEALATNNRESPFELLPVTNHVKSSFELLPVTNNVVKLVNHIDSSIPIAIKAIDDGSRTYQTYTRLATLVLSRIILFNKRRSIEAAIMKIEEYKNRPSEPQNTEEMKPFFSPFEQKLTETLSVVYIENTKGEKAPVIIPPLINNSIDILIKHRPECDISVTNNYVFARSNPSPLSLRGNECLRTICREIGLGNSQIITGSKMEEYVAAVCQLLDMNENQYDWLVRHLGFDTTVHKVLHRTRGSATELTELSRLLLAVDGAGANQYSGKNLEEIEMKVEDQFDEPEYVHINSVSYTDMEKLLRESNKKKHHLAQSQKQPSAREGITPVDMDGEDIGKIPVRTKRGRASKRIRLVPVDANFIPVAKKTRILSRHVEKQRREDSVCVLFTSFTSEGDYINDHDYLISPYVRNKLFYHHGPDPMCVCLLCDLVHKEETHVEHMKRHSTMCNICKIDFHNPFILNLHAPCHFWNCMECGKNVTYGGYWTHARDHESSMHFNNSQLIGSVVQMSMNESSDRPQSDPVTSGGRKVLTARIIAPKPEKVVSEELNTPSVTPSRRSSRISRKTYYFDDDDKEKACTKKEKTKSVTLSSKKDRTPVQNNTHDEEKKTTDNMSRLICKENLDDSDSISNENRNLPPSREGTTQAVQENTTKDIKQSSLKGPIIIKKTKIDFRKYYKQKKAAKARQRKLDLLKAAMIDESHLSQSKNLTNEDIDIAHLENENEKLPSKTLESENTFEPSQPSTRRRSACKKQYNRTDARSPRKVPDSKTELITESTSNNSEEILLSKPENSEKASDPLDGSTRRKSAYRKQYNRTVARSPRKVSDSPKAELIAESASNHSEEKLLSTTENSEKAFEPLEDPTRRRSAYRKQYNRTVGRSPREVPDSKTELIVESASNRSKEKLLSETVHSEKAFDPLCSSRKKSAYRKQYHRTNAKSPKKVQDLPKPELIDESTNHPKKITDATISESLEKVSGNSEEKLLSTAVKGDEPFGPLLEKLLSNAVESEKASEHSEDLKDNSKVLLRKALASEKASDLSEDVEENSKLLLSKALASEKTSDPSENVNKNSEVLLSKSLATDKTSVPSEDGKESAEELLSKAVKSEKASERSEDVRENSEEVLLKAEESEKAPDSSENKDPVLEVQEKTDVESAEGVQKEKEADDKKDNLIKAQEDIKKITDTTKDGTRPEVVIKRNPLRINRSSKGRGSLGSIGRQDTERRSTSKTPKK